MSTIQIERLNINAWDWTHAKRYCRRYLENHLFSRNIDDARAYTTAIVVAYSRPFSGNRDRLHKREKVDARFVDALDSTHRAVHDRVVDLRDQQFAHSDAAAHNVKIENTIGGGMATLSQDPIIPLKQSEVECLLANIERFAKINAILKSEAVAAYLASP